MSATTSSNTMKYKEELYNLDPLHRMDNVPLFKEDGVVPNAKKYILNLKTIVHHHHYHHHHTYQSNIYIHACL